MDKFGGKGHFNKCLPVITIVFLGIGGMQFASAGLDNGQVNLEAKLSQEYGEGSGKAMFVAQDYRVRLSIEILNMISDCNSFSAKMSGIAVAGIFEENDGACNLTLDTRAGDTVPAVVAGDEVLVSGKGITLSGILHFT
jgi:hypothetical protein